MKILVIGSGGREHALCWKLRQSPRVTELFCAPGNAGTEALGRNLAIPIADLDALATFAETEGIGLTVVGPDDALAAGIVDLFQRRGLRIFGPTKAAAQFESSKAFAKRFMERHGIPTARFGEFTESAEAHRFCQKMNYPLVIKADGLALGKGVIIAAHADQAAKAIYRIMEQRQFGDAGRRIIIEEFLTGEECSLHALVDGPSYALFPSAQDHKRALDGDQGLNTGGMGAYSPAPVLTPELERQAREQVLEPFVSGLQADGLSFNTPAQRRPETAKFDGKDHPEEGSNPEQGPAIAAQRLDEHHLIITHKYNAKLTGTEDVQLSPDLKTLTITLHFTGRAKPDVMVYQRQ